MTTQAPSAALDGPTATQDIQARTMLRSFGFSRTKKASATSVTSHWAHLLENFAFSSREFYQRVEAALQQRQVPELTAKHVIWNEGGALSPRRKYLRIQRGRSVFDICAAPFGTGFFVSSWSGEKPLKLGWLLLLLLNITLMAYRELPTSRVETGGSPGQMYDSTGRWTIDAPQTEIVTAHYGIFHRILPSLGHRTFAYVMLSIIGCSLVIAFGLVVYFPDATLMRIPVVGYFYERYFRRITYYRFDLHCVYQAAVHAAVMEVIDELTKTHSLKPLSEEERFPQCRDFFSTLLPYERRH